MNSPRKNVNNLLFLPKTREYADEMYKVILQYVTSGKTVAILTQSGSAPKLLPLMKKSNIEVYKNKQALQRIIFICCENISGTIKKLLDLHDWTVKPNIILIDLFTFVSSKDATRFSPGNVKTSAVVPCLHPMVQCIAVLFNMLNGIQIDESEQKFPIHQQPTEIVTSKIFSIVVLQESSSTALTLSQLELVIELYYGSNTYDDFKRIIDVINLEKTV